MREKLIFLIVILVSFSSLSQQVTNWKIYTDMKNVADVGLSDQAIWAVTDGGAFRYSTSDNNFKSLTKADGLIGNSLTSITFDNTGRVWFGSAEGIIDIYNDSDESFNVILDIANSSQANKQINFLTRVSDTVIVSSDFGVSLIDANSFLFFDTFFKFGEFTTNTRVNYAIKDYLFYICTDEGIAFQKQGATNLSAPESWDTYNTSDGLPSNKTNKIVKYLGNLIAATDLGITLFDGNQWQPFLIQFANKVVSDLVVLNDSLLILSEQKIYTYRDGVAAEFYSSPTTLRRLSVNNQLGIAGASTNGVLFIDENNETDFIVPNGPLANQFPSISVDNNGVFWSASGKDNTGVGFYTFEKGIWKNYNRNNTPALPSNDIYFVFNSPDNRAYLGTWGKGFIRTDGVTFETFDTTNSGMKGIPDNPNFLVITGFSTDTKNNVWILNLAPANQKILSMLTPDSTWHHFIIPAAQNRTLKANFNLDVDPYDTKWFASRDATTKVGLFYFNEMRTYEDVSDDRSGFLTTADGLSSSEIHAVRVDKRGEVWVGTNLGVNVITNNITISSSGNTSLNISSIFALRQQSVNDIAVDPLNQKWIATNEGLLLVNSDGSRLLAAYDSENSPLLEDKVVSLAIDENAGIVYAATDRGLISFETPFIKPQESFDKLFVYPNPFEIDNGESLLTIDGLVSDSNIKILTIDAKLISEFPSPGGRVAFWDGKDDNGNLVNSGVYLIVAFDRDGSNIITGKVAVLRK